MIENGGSTGGFGSVFDGGGVYAYCVNCGFSHPLGSCLSQVGAVPITPPVLQPQFNQPLTGWICPQCSVGVAPFVNSCPRCIPRR